MFDKNRPVFVKKGFYDKRGNYFPADESRPYRLVAVPAERRTPEYLSQGLVKRVTTEEDMAKAIGLNPNETKTLKATNTKITESPKLNVNAASKGELEALKYVGPSTAATLIEVRGAEKFSSLKELDERVPLPQGRSWSVLESEIGFD